MKVFFLPIAFTSLSLACLAQSINFIHADPQPDLSATYGGAFASGDIDGDGDNDLLIGGGPPGGTALYLNDGLGKFTEVEDSPILQLNLRSSHIRFVDLDDDEDLDLFISGSALFVPQFTHIYLNDGLGAFTLMPNPSLLELRVGSFAIDDVNRDGAPDLIIAGFNTHEVEFVDIFLNDGNATFTPKGHTVFTTAINARVQWFDAVEFIDVENDGDLDVLLGGNDSDDSAFFKLYLNDGSGNYDVKTDTGFLAISGGDLDIADIDNDGDSDILISGRSNLGELHTILYNNDGSGQFTELMTSHLQETLAGENAIADMDNDGDQDILITGSQTGGLPNIYNIIYENLGNQRFVPIDTVGGEYISDCLIKDFTGDGLKDIVIQGFVANTNVYWNASIVTSTEKTESHHTTTVYPNPSHGILNIEIKNSSEFSLKIYDMSGELVLFNIEMKNNKPIPINQSPGLYMIVIQTDHDTSTHKLVLK